MAGPALEPHGLGSDLGFAPLLLSAFSPPVVGLVEMIHGQHLAQGQAHSKRSGALATIIHLFIL